MTPVRDSFISEFINESRMTHVLRDSGHKIRLFGRTIYFELLSFTTSLRHTMGDGTGKSSNKSLLNPFRIETIRNNICLLL